MTLSLIVAVAEDGAIGAQNDLLWHLSGDLKRFAATTTGHSIIMGRNTFLSLPNGPLPKRRNIVVSSSMASTPGVEIFQSLEEAISATKGEKEVFIIGGAQLYSSAIDKAHRLYLTRVHHSFPEADTFFPCINWEEWKQESQEAFPADERNEYATTLYIYNRK